MNNLRTEYGNHTINSQKLEEFSHTLSTYRPPPRQTLYTKNSRF